MLRRFVRNQQTVFVHRIWYLPCLGTMHNVSSIFIQLWHHFPSLFVLLTCYFIWRCAMALVHHRFKRVFYAFPNPVNGALGGVYRLHGEKSLNHHYNVFRISVPETYLNGLNDGSKQCWWHRTSYFHFSWRMDPWVSVLQHGCHFWYKGCRVQIRFPW